MKWKLTLTSIAGLMDSQKKEDLELILKPRKESATWRAQDSERHSDFWHIHRIAEY
jgi:hypothetical protein